MPPRPRLASALPGPSTLRQHGAVKSSSPSPRPRAYATDASTAIRPLVATLPSRSRYAYKEPELTVDHLVVGGGVVGLAIAAALARRWPDKSTYLVERHRHFGEETSSRNSEVIHAGLYYPSHSLKTRLCLEGRELMYQRCQRLGIPYKQTKKLVVGGDYAQPYLAKLKQHCDSLGPLSPPTRLLSGDEARQLEPDLADSIGCALLSERTGVVSSHELMASLERELLDAENAEIVYDTRVVRVDPSRASSSSSSLGAKRGTDGSRQGWVVQTVTSDAGTSSDSDALLAKVVVNSSGLNGPMVLNSLLGSMGSQEPLIPMWYAKGNYASYKGPGTRNVEHLIYPVPDTRKGTHAHTSLGTHLTLDLDGNVRFGPDTEWLSPPAPSSSSSSSSSSLDAVDEDHIDFWRKSLTVSESRLPTMYSQITEYLPHISRDGLAPDYAGIRPKLIGPGQGGFMDFTFLWHRSGDLGSQHLWQHAPGTGPASPTTTTATTPPPVGRHHVQAPSEGSGGAMISLLGIESPGLTSSLAIGEYVRDMVARSYYGDHRKEEVRNKGARNEDVGGSGVDAWA